ncbi:MAG TPA: hypothetical protein VIL20_03320 [Sandaracinaceae bacterium]
MIPVPAAERRARRAIGWGASVALAVVALVAALTIVMVAAGARVAPFASELDAIVVAASMSVALVGVVVIAYGLVQLTHARREGRKRGAA